MPAWTPLREVSDESYVGRIHRHGGARPRKRRTTSNIWYNDNAYIYASIKYGYACKIIKDIVKVYLVGGETLMSTWRERETGKERE